MNITTLSDTDLYQRTNDCAARVSFFEAAEGNYSAETQARDSAKHAYRECRAELKRRGLVWENTRGYLVSE